MLRRRLELLRETLQALLGDRDACHNLGATYATGDHGNWPEIRNVPAAVRWYKRGAKRGSPECLYDLGLMSVLREFPGADPNAGIRSLVESANKGYCDSIRLLADLYTRGLHGVSADQEQGEYWSRRLEEHLVRHPDDRRLHER